MSKWLRRGLGQNNNNLHNSDENNAHNGEGPPESAPAGLIGGGTTASVQYNPPPPQSAMGGYGASSPAAVAMDVADHQSSRTKNMQYSQQYQGAPIGTVPRKGYDATGSERGSARSRHSSSGNRDDSTQRRSRSSRSSGSQRSDAAPQAGNGAPVQQYHYSSTGQPQGGAGATSANGNSTSAPPQHQSHHFQAPQMPPPTQYGQKSSSPVVSASPPPDASQQGGYSGTTIQSQAPIQQNQSSQRRPAYLLHRDLVIGKGSYGQVCIASRGEAEGHSSSGRNGSGKRKKFACKCVVLRNDPKYIAKLQEEVNVLRELRGHENVIRLYDVFCVDNELFIITELGRGGDLFHLLTTHPKHGVTEAYAAKTVSQMLSAVAFLHSRHIVHRDLKLENWVLESGKDVWSPLKLIDFGLSTHFTAGHRLSRVVGSSYYVAPEVLKKSYTEACDLWSLGVIVYMLLSGAPPFYGKNDEAIKASIVQGEYTFPHELFRDVSDEAMAFVSTLLSYNIEYRYTAEQALTHPWLAANLDPEQLQRTKDGARGVGTIAVMSENGGRPEAMQM